MGAAIIYLYSQRKKIKAGSCPKRGEKKRSHMSDFTKDAQEMFPLHINLTEILKIREVPQGVRLASQKHLL